MPYKLRDDDYLRLWLHFQDRADNVKEAMFKTLTWTVGFAAALLGFIFVNLTSYDTSKAAVPLSAVVTIAAAAGLVICLYSWIMLSESAKHIQGNWERADRCGKHVENLGKLIHGDGKKNGKTMKIWNQLRIIVVLFGVAFTAILLWRMCSRITCQ
jgi:uncharacterized membrane protein (DUF485 family)